MGINGEPWPLMETKEHSAENKDIRWRMDFHGEQETFYGEWVLMAN